MALDDNHLIELATLKAWLQPKPSASISAVTAAAVGTGYTTATVTITDANGIGAVITPNIVAGTIPSYNIDAAGNDYVAPVVTITGDGTGATATAKIGVDDTLSQLIIDASQIVLNLANIPRFFNDDTTVTEIRNGNGKGEMILMNRPVVSITSVTAGGVAIQASDGNTGGWLSDGSGLYLIGHTFPRGVRNVSVVLKAGYAVGSQQAINAGRAVLAIATFEWKKSPYAHVSSESASQGMGTSISINTAALPALAKEIIESLTRPMMYDLF